MPLTTAHQTDRIVTHNKLLFYFKATHSTSIYCFSTISIPTTDRLIYWSVCQLLFLLFISYVKAQRIVIAIVAKSQCLRVTLPVGG
jgi:hypothetical protein